MPGYGDADFVVSGKWKGGAEYAEAVRLLGRAGRVRVVEDDGLVVRASFVSATEDPLTATHRSDVEDFAYAVYDDEADDA